MLRLVQPLSAFHRPVIQRGASYLEAAVEIGSFLESDGRIHSARGTLLGDGAIHDGFWSRSIVARPCMSPVNPDP